MKFLNPKINKCIEKKIKDSINDNEFYNGYYNESIDIPYTINQITFESCIFEKIDFSLSLIHI